MGEVISPQLMGKGMQMGTMVFLQLGRGRIISLNGGTGCECHCKTQLHYVSSTAFAVGRRSLHRLIRSHHIPNDFVLRGPTHINDYPCFLHLFTSSQPLFPFGHFYLPRFFYHIGQFLVFTYNYNSCCMEITILFDYFVRETIFGLP